jgi:hypothetical protein
MPADQTSRAVEESPMSDGLGGWDGGTHRLSGLDT